MNNQKNSHMIHALTRIGRIGIVKRSGSEWSTFTKTIQLETVPDQALIRFESHGVSGVFINGVYLEGNTGRYPNRIACVECTAKLNAGENEIKLVSGGHYYQPIHHTIRGQAGSQFSFVAAELTLTTGGITQTVTTDATWQCVSDDGQTVPTCFSEVTVGEYNRFWKAAALIPEYRPVTCSGAVADVAGESYLAYIGAPWQEYAEPQAILETNLHAEGIDSFVKYDFGKLYVGYLLLECTAEQAGTVQLDFDFTENPDDLEYRTQFSEINERLAIREPLSAGSNHILFLRRRACRFLKLSFDCKVHVQRVCFRLSMTPPTQLGWFHCDREIFNKMWEVGKYTLHVNKHLEYESCPRSEMKYFSGDGIADALIDYCAFGDPSLTYSSLSLTEPDLCCGLVPEKYARNVPLTDYPAWRILSVYNQYRYFGDRELVAQYFDELAACMDWMIEKMNSACLIYQYPVYADPFYTTRQAVEFTCSTDRLGEKPLINALLYQSLLCMREFAALMGDERQHSWHMLAGKVHAAFNERLWSDAVNAYVDTYDPSYIPQDGNALALLFGLATGKRAELVQATLREQLWTPYGSALLSEPLAHTRNGSKTLSPVMNMYEAEARFRNGDTTGALTLMERCWGTMLRKGAETFWEFAPTDAEARWPIPSHAWSGGCTYLLSTYVLGISPATPGYETVRFHPCDCAFEHFAGVVPTCRGLIAVCCQTENRQKKYTLAVPEGMHVTIEQVPPQNVSIHVYPG